jgi:protein-disulfide isomerase
MLQSLFAICRHRWCTRVLAMATLTCVGIVSQPRAATPEIPAVVATVQGQPITADELTTALRSELMRLEMERYQALKQKLDELIGNRLMALEAKQRGISAEQLEQDAIVSKLPPIPQERIKEFYEANKNRIRQPLEQVTSRIEAHLQQQERAKLQQALLRELRQRYPVTIDLQAPTVDVGADDDPFLGPKDAPVTIIEFSDFQCPYCRRVQPTLKQLLQEYQQSVKLVFRDFPLRNIHPQAQKASEAAQCAAEQQQFWPYHDKLFSVSELEPENLKQYAQELGLNTTQFNACLDSSKYAPEVERDLQDGLSAGVNATPSFFVNGQPISGAVGYEQFKEVVEAVLERNKNVKRANP